jgi:hypothetical protein
LVSLDIYEVEGVEGILVAMDGEFSAELPPGKYIVTNNKPGGHWKNSDYEDFSTRVELYAGQVKDIEIHLKLKETSEEKQK